jgi:hypothetical protein
MITSRQLIEQIQKNVGVPLQSQRSDGFSDGILFGSADATVTGIVTTFIGIREQRDRRAGGP